MYKKLIKKKKKEKEKRSALQSRKENKNAIGDDATVIAATAADSKLFNIIVIFIENLYKYSLK
jgi:hypothetical protein